MNPLLESSRLLFRTAPVTRSLAPVHVSLLAVKRYSELKTVLAHCGGGGIILGEAIVAAALVSNNYLNLSSLMPHQVFEAFQRVGSDRLMAGSDLTENPNIEMSKILDLAISDEDKTNVLTATACRVFGQT